MADKPTPRELNLDELDRVAGGSNDLVDLLKTVIHLLTGGGPVMKGLR
jgi:hypothetical protein